MLEWVVFIFDACSASRRRVHSLEPSRSQLIHEPGPLMIPVFVLASVRDPLERKTLFSLDLQRFY